jgi:F-type H+-transporting ATPase subunit b
MTSINDDIQSINLILRFRFKFFYPKTGVTGPYVFLAGLTTYCFSKEIYVMEHEFYTGLSILVAVVYATKKFGPGLAKALDKQVDVR